MPDITFFSEDRRWSRVALGSAARGARGGGAERGEHELPAGGVATERRRAVKRQKPVTRPTLRGERGGTHMERGSATDRLSSQPDLVIQSECVLVDQLCVCTIR